MLRRARHSRMIFRDPSGRRARLVTWVTRTMGVTTTCLGFTLIFGLLTPAPLPRIVIADSSASVRRPEFAASRASRERIAARRRLFQALAVAPAPAGGRAALPSPARGASSRPTPPITAGFYVNWDDNSFASLKTHATRLDWVIGEWGMLDSSGSSVRIGIDARVLKLVSVLPAPERPALMLMLSNYDSARAHFNGDMLRRLVSSPANRAAVVAKLAGTVRQYALGGVTVDFEEIPEDVETGPHLLQFLRELASALHANGAVLSQAIAAGTELRTLAKFAAVDDFLILMAYDEHAGPRDAGPVASQAWFIAESKRAASVVPANKLILGMGAYGYDWNDAEPDAPGDEQTFQDVMRAAHMHHAAPRFDSVSLTPYLTWDDADSTTHVLWYLDGVTAFNQTRVARALHAAGTAVWRLGAEEPSLWNAIGRGAPHEADSLREMSAGYDIAFSGTGEILRIAARPRFGRRTLRVEPGTGVVVAESVTVLPLPFIVQRSGNYRNRVALTFDDGPDGTWTEKILDTLRARHAPATFFLIGSQVERHIGLARRIMREGHEVGNHTFTHPNLALTGEFATRLEINAAQRVIEAVLGRHTAFFRPPYFGDAEPTTADELVPIAIATDLGYATAGLHVDSDDWRQHSPSVIIANVLEGRRRAVTCTDSLHMDRSERRPLEEGGCSGSIVLLHDGGGDREGTVAAVGPMIDSLRAQGDTLVLLSALAGITHAQAMPPIPPSSRSVRFAELAAFGTLGAFEWTMYWVFLAAVVLGVARLGMVGALAIAQRLRSRDRGGEPSSYTPTVTVVVPAFREEKVIEKTIASLLAQDYAGELDVVVVDDGSPDGTYETAERAYRGHPRVAVHRKPNGGKASALNYGIARARGEIIIGLDADTVFRADTTRRLVRPLANPRVAAVAGNAKVGNRINLVTRWQAVEYVTSQNLDRRAFALLDCITVVPGAVGAWRKSVVEELGGFSEDTLAEDQDLTIAMHLAGHSVAFAPNAVALTEAPDTLRGLANQRFRWSFGTLQCMWKHRGALMRRRFGALGIVAMPNVWLFQLLFPAVSPVADLMFVWSLVSVWLMKLHHGSTYALSNLEQVLVLYAVFLLVDWVAAAVAFLMEHEEWGLIWLVLTQRFVYRQIMYFVVLRSFRAAVRGRMVGWGRLDRKATVGAQT